jgi:hypothetical protein
MVFGAQVSLNAFSMGGTSLGTVSNSLEMYLNRNIPVINMLSGFVTSDEADSLNSRIVADSIDSGNTTMNDIQYACW